MTNVNIQAYLQGQLDPEYEHIIRAITGILFMATPHRGSNLAETLSRILQVSLISSSKNYVGDLIKNSFALQKINDQFRHIAPKLNIVSFYETQPTPIGFKMNRIVSLPCTYSSKSPEANYIGRWWLRKTHPS